MRAWGSIQWQADLAAGLGAVPVLAALLGTKAVVAAAVVALLVAVGASFAPDGPRLPGSGGRLAAAGILVLAVVPALGAACVVLVRTESVIAAVVLIVLASAYEVASQELAVIGAHGDWASDEPAWAHFVDQAEEAISREHTTWRASHT